MYINMNAYQKIYNNSGDHGMPSEVFLDRGNGFSFSLVLLSHKDTFTNDDSEGWGLLRNQGMRPEYSVGGWGAGIRPQAPHPTPPPQEPLLMWIRSWQ